MVVFKLLVQPSKLAAYKMLKVCECKKIENNLNPKNLLSFQKKFSGFQNKLLKSPT